MNLAKFQLNVVATIATPPCGGWAFGH